MNTFRLSSQEKNTQLTPETNINSWKSKQQRKNKCAQTTDPPLEKN